MTYHIGNGIYISSKMSIAEIMKMGNFSMDAFNLTAGNVTYMLLEEPSSKQPPVSVTSLPGVQIFFSILYALIFLTGIIGNVLVCYVVIRKKSMHTVTNFFITNLALADVLLCTFAVPFTPLYVFLQEWIFGGMLCKIVPYAQGVSVYISAFTLMSIAIDRYFVIIYPFKARMSIHTCIGIIVLVWVAALLLTLPYGMYMGLIQGPDGRWYCDEAWPSAKSRPTFGMTTSILQFVAPFLIIAFCYTRVCHKLRKRANAIVGAKSARKEEQERERTRRTNRMLISMVVIFGASWMPINVYNLVVDFHVPASYWSYLNLVFFISHAIAMSSVCYNPFLYAWMNENFRKEFRTILPCLRIFNPPQNINENTEQANGQDTVLENFATPTNAQRSLRTKRQDFMKNTTTTVSMIDMDND